MNGIRDGHTPIPAEKRLLVDAHLAAELLSVSLRKLWEMKNAGEIPHVRIGRCVRYPVGRLLAWADRRRQEGFYGDESGRSNQKRREARRNSLSSAWRKELADIEEYLNKQDNRS